MTGKDERDPVPGAEGARGALGIRMPRERGERTHRRRHAADAGGDDQREFGLGDQARRLLDRGGDRAGALREYEAFARRLADEYQAGPSPETRTA